MTTDDHIKQLKATVAKLAQNVPLAIAAQSVHAMRVKRIFDNPGVGGKYTGGEMWVPDSKLRRNGNHEGKPFDSGKKYKSGTKKGQSIKWRKVGNKTTYYPDYSSLKKQQGFNPNVVNLRLTNDLQSDFANAPITSGTALNVGKVIKVTDNIYIEGLRRPNNVKKLEGNIKRFGDFTRFTDAERDEFNKVLQFEFNKILKSE